MIVISATYRIKIVKVVDVFLYSDYEYIPLLMYRYLEDILKLFFYLDLFIIQVLFYLHHSQWYRNEQQHIFHYDY